MASTSDTTEPARPAWPRAGASIAVFRGDEVLIVERAKPPRSGMWAMPGGHVEPGERAADAAIRELAEETGVEADLVGLVTVHDSIHHDREGRLVAHYVLCVYAGRWRAGEPTASSDAANARFVPLGELGRWPLLPHSERIINDAWRLVSAG